MQRRAMINVGFGNYVAAERIVAVVNPDNSPSRRLRAEARDSERLIDATQGRKTRSLIVTDSNHVVLSPVVTETLAHRFSSTDKTGGEAK